ncbi:Atu4866 domain-containing protein [Streptomyces sp. ACA25]|uniref:Atu4866 domain-containing protein n=1 Tax=Streptomyces sp. ACA25 TaxID=3022596 RepID=UPI002307D409|nr:Atu4866 domain-containing protein [Streptomyces sp. ACA25]MDB1088696.1 Atu4866 domain-containing protein [Streptomyces sp. ACA25]
MDTTPWVRPRRDDGVLRDLRAPEGRPLLLTGGTVITCDQRLGDWQEADVLIGGAVIVGVGPGLLTAAGDDNMIVIDCAGTLVLPAAPGFAAAGPGATLTPGEAADIAVLRLADAPETPTGAVPARGTHLDVLVTAGQVRLWNGLPLDPGTSPPAAPHGAPAPVPDQGNPFVGLWVDGHDFVRQELLPDGRYDEARGDRPSAYRGRYWIDGNRIDYLDDLGFWAYGEFRDGILHHAGYRFTRR